MPTLSRSGDEPPEPAYADGGSKSKQGETDGTQHPAHQVFDDGIGEKGALVHRVGANEGMV